MSAFAEPAAGEDPDASIGGMHWSEAEGPLDQLSPNKRAALDELRTAATEGGWSCPETEQNIGTFRLDDRTLLRFLVARDFKVADASTMLQEHLKWRKVHVPSTITAADLPNTHDAGMFRLMGRSRHGVNVMLCDMRAFEPSKFSLEEFEKYVMFNSERAIRLMNPDKPGQNIWVFDLASWSVTKHGSVKATKMTKTLIGTAQDHYPERLVKALVINAPWLFQGFWKVIHPFINAKTRKKVKFAAPSVLADILDPAQLPERYGGTMQGDLPVHPDETCFAPGQTGTSM